MKVNLLLLKEFRTEKVINEKVINFMSIGKVMTIFLIAGLIKKTSQNDLLSRSR